MKVSELRKLVESLPADESDCEVFVYVAGEHRRIEEIHKCYGYPGRPEPDSLDIFLAMSVKVK